MMKKTLIFIIKIKDLNRFQVKIKFKDVTKFKTELCKEFILYSFCKYGFKCKFAHGKSELMLK